LPVKNMSRICGLALLAALLTAPIGVANAQDVAGSLNDAIVGTWVGEVSQGETKFQTRLTFVSPKGGIRRYPGFPCGGTLIGDRKGDGYQFDEVVTWGGTDEKTDGCIGGLVKITVDGDKMIYDWSATYNGTDHAATGELRRVGKKR
jgi:hypothetical protein